MTPHQRLRFLPVLDAGEGRFLGSLLRKEAFGGGIVLIAAVVAVVWANSPWSQAYVDLVHLDLGPLDLGHWASDGALTLFFFLAGLELKREFLLGSLRRPSDAVVPVFAAACGVALPAALYTLANLDGGRPDGWAIPAATDIAFALAVLAVVAPSLPTQLRAFLLTLAIVDDLIVIVIIATFYTERLHLVSLAGAVILLGAYVFLQTFRGEHWILYVPLALGIWWLTHESGIHATIAGVAMGLATRVIPDKGEDRSPAEALEHLLTPCSAGFAIPFFALMSAGVELHLDGDFVKDPVVIGILLGLIVGKPLGVFGGAWLITRFTRAELGAGLRWRDIAGISILAGIGFTVALLVAELSFADGGAEPAKAAVMLGSVTAGLCAALVLRSGAARRTGDDQTPVTL
jgi:NhaA family Na+:H+ antiporter